VPSCSHAQNECHMISSPDSDINLHVLLTSNRSMQEHTANLLSKMHIQANVSAGARERERGRAREKERDRKKGGGAEKGRKRARERDRQRVRACER